MRYDLALPLGQRCRFQSAHPLTAPEQGFCGGEELLSALAANLANRFKQGFVKPNQRMANRMRLVRRAECYLDAHLAEPITIAGLCLALGCPIHTLERTFVGALGTTPRRFLNQRRMARLRRVLLAANADELSVTEAMLNCGLYHTGRSATLYRQYFGESPKTTLALSAARADRRLPPEISNRLT